MTRDVKLELDIENLVDFFQIKLLDERGNTIYNFALWPGSPPLPLQQIADLLAGITIYTFNGNHYDVPILTLALYGATHQELKAAGDAIIKGGLKSWEFYDRYKIQTPDYIDHVDLFDVAPGVSIGLKMYMGRIHAPKMQDLPVSFDTPILLHERMGISQYCDNDLQGTNLLRHGLVDRLKLRDAMSAQYKTDLRSKSDAQIAEAVIKAQLGFTPNKRYIPHGFTFPYEPPACIRFITPAMQELLDVIRNARFMVSSKEEAVALGLEDVKTGVLIPPELKGRDIRIGQTVYRMGIGGLHSQESSVNYHSIPGVQVLKDIDVRSFYPSLIIALNMSPEQMGDAFQKIFKDIYHTRLKAKDEATKLYDFGFLSEALEQQTIADGLKIVLNGTFGKLFSKWSKPLYAPELGIRVTMTGQLYLLMLIEMMEVSGIRCVSANTDGIVLLIPEGYDFIVQSNIKWWEKQTGMEMEETIYRAIYSRDVNNYIAITDKGKVKRKGVFAPGGLLSGPQGKHPDKDICADAVVAFLQHGTPIADTIQACTDVRKFVQIRQVKGGAIDLPEGIAISDGKYLGKAVRWYYGQRRGYIGTKDVGNRVAGSDGATPIMELPTQLPADINYQHYINVANEMLIDLGVK